MKVDQHEAGPGPESMNDMMLRLAKMAEEITRIGSVVNRMQRDPDTDSSTDLPSPSKSQRQRVVSTQLSTPEFEPPPAKPLDVRDRIEVALTEQSLSTQQLAKIVGVSIEKTAEIIKTLRSADKIYNVGYEDSAIWTWKIGNDTDTPTLVSVVRRLLSERPMWARDLVRATGAKESRVQGAIVEVQRTGKVIDLSGGGHAKKYFLISDTVFDATLPPKKVDGKVIRHGEPRVPRGRRVPRIPTSKK